MFRKGLSLTLHLQNVANPHVPEIPSTKNEAT
jgi:hypothetical protein